MGQAGSYSIPNIEQFIEKKSRINEKTKYKNIRKTMKRKNKKHNTTQKNQKTQKYYLQTGKKY